MPLIATESIPSSMMSAVQMTLRLSWHGFLDSDPSFGLVEGMMSAGHRINKTTCNPQ